MKLPSSSCRALGLRRRWRFANGHHDSNREWINSNPHSADAPSSLAGRQSRSKILLVDHVTEIDGQVRFGLEQQGLDVLAASTASEGIETAIRCQSRVVSLDIEYRELDPD